MIIVVCGLLFLVMLVYNYLNNMRAFEDIDDPEDYF